jgi:mevalonate kinase
MMDKKFPAKVLLFGEHTILRGSSALAAPLWARHSQWKTGGTAAQQASLVDMAAYLEEHFSEAFDLTKFRKDLAAGYYLDSNIPVGYGLGSSGAVCVAVYTTYITPQGEAQLESEGAKVFFARMEAFFHGTSSGTDPLIIYLQQAIRLLPDGGFQQETIPPLPPGWKLFLLDTGKSRQTAPLVAYFTRRFDEEADFRNAVRTQWIAPTNAAIEALLTGETEALWQHFRQISQFQIDHLPPMVLPSINDIWQQGLASDHYLLKICGAGGGGYCLGLSCDWEKTQKALGGGGDLRGVIVPIRSYD